MTDAPQPPFGQAPDAVAIEPGPAQPAPAQPAPVAATPITTGPAPAPVQAAAAARAALTETKETVEELLGQMSSTTVQLVKLEDQLASLAEGTTEFREEVVEGLVEVRRLMEHRFAEQLARQDAAGSGTAFETDGITRRVDMIDDRISVMSGRNRTLVALGVVQGLLLVGLLAYLVLGGGGPQDSAPPPAASAATPTMSTAGDYTSPVASPEPRAKKRRKKRR